MHRVRKMPEPRGRVRFLLDDKRKALLTAYKNSETKRLVYACCHRSQHRLAAGRDYESALTGYLCVENRMLGPETVDENTGKVTDLTLVRPSHYMHPEIGHMLWVENPDVWVRAVTGAVIPPKARW